MLMRCWYHYSVCLYQFFNPPLPPDRTRLTSYLRRPTRLPYISLYLPFIRTPRPFSPSIYIPTTHLFVLFLFVLISRAFRPSPTFFLETTYVKQFKFLVAIHPTSVLSSGLRGRKSLVQQLFVFAPL